jgi:hypothetical protein
MSNSLATAGTKQPLIRKCFFTGDARFMPYSLTPSLVRNCIFYFEALVFTGQQSTLTLIPHRGHSAKMVSTLSPLVILRAISTQQDWQWIFIV